MVTGAWTASFIYNAGKALADVAGKRVTNGPLEWLAAICDRADFIHFYHASLILAAVGWLLPFTEWFRRDRKTGAGTGDPLPLDGVRSHDKGQRFLSNPRGPRQFVTGFLVTMVVFSLIIGAAVFSGALLWNPPTFKDVGKMLALAVALACLQEFIFRGVVMGIFLRAMRPAAALGLSAMLFAMIHFLIPDTLMSPRDPEASGAGMEVFGKLIGRWGEAPAVMGILLPYLALGILLGFSRWKTSSLWLPVGIHTGWLFSQLCLQLVAFAEILSPSGSFPHASLTQGLILLPGIFVAGLLSLRLSAPYESVS